VHVRTHERQLMRNATITSHCRCCCCCFTTQDPIPHVSLAWVPGDQAQVLQQWLDSFEHSPVATQVGPSTLGAALLQCVAESAELEGGSYRVGDAGRCDVVAGAGASMQDSVNVCGCRWITRPSMYTSNCCRTVCMTPCNSNMARSTTYEC
jgi:hypothetical protein